MTISKQIPLIASSDAWASTERTLGGSPIDTSRSVGVLNGYYEVNQNALTDSKKISLNKRPGVVDASRNGSTVYPTVTNNNERILGVTTDLTKTKVYWASKDATKTYSNYWDGTGAPPGTVTQTDITAAFPVATTQNFAFTQLDGISYGANNYFAVTNGAQGALINASGVWSAITDVDFTGNGVKTNFVALDGYLFYGVISGTNAGRIYNSDLNAAAAASGWTASAYLTPADVPGAIVWLGRLRNYIVVFKQYSIEFLEDVGNPTPGSPLEQRKSLTKRIGCASSSSVQEVSDGLIFLGIDQKGKLGVWKLSTEDFSVKKISDANLEVILHSKWQPASTTFQDYSVDFVATGSGGQARGESQVIIWQNKELYLITVNSANFTSTPWTYVYDNQLGLWTTWQTAFSAGNNGFYASQAFQLFIGGGYQTYLVNNYAVFTQKARFCALGNNNGLTPSTLWYQDGNDGTNASNYLFQFNSDLVDFGTHDRKFLNSLELIYNGKEKNVVFDNSSTNTDTFYIQILKQDFNNSSNLISKPVNDSGWKRVKFNRLGSFRSVAVKIYSNLPAPLKLWAIEVVYSGGPQYA